MFRQQTLAFRLGQLAVFAFVIAAMFAVVLLSGCAAPTYKIDPEFAPHVEEFRKQYKLVTGKDLQDDGLVTEFVEEFLDEDGKTTTIVGQCRLGEGPPKVSVKKSYWKMSEYRGDDEERKQKLHLEREELIFHELGHCWLLQDHRDFQMPDGSMGSLMNAYVLGTDYNIFTRAYYLRELFKAKADWGRGIVQDPPDCGGKKQ